MEMSTDLQGVSHFCGCVATTTQAHNLETQAKRKWLVEESVVKRRLSLAPASSSADTDKHNTHITHKSSVYNYHYLEGMYDETKDFPTNLRHHIRTPNFK